MEKSSTKSTWPLAAIWSMISLVSWRTWGISSRTRRGVKPWLMRRRVRMCSSPSIVMIDMSPAI